MLHAAWPPLACLTLFVVGVIILILKYGHRCFGARVTTLPQPWERRQSQYQYQMEVLDVSVKEAPRQPLSAGALMETTYGSREMLGGQYDEEPRRIIDTRVDSREHMEIIQPTPQYASGSREAAV